jgi:ATP-dependent 26S proteasome regulatory subunit
VRFSLKDLGKAYEKTEDDIKAVQSIGQIIGEVMKQLDDERCAHPLILASGCGLIPSSHRQGVVWPPLRGFVPADSSGGEAEIWHSCRT